MKQTEIEENYLTTFYTLNLDLFANMEKLL